MESGEGADTDEVLPDRGKDSHLWTLLAWLLVLALVGVGLTIAHRGGPVYLADQGVSARIVLTSTTVKAGSAISGSVIVNNLSGQPLQVGGCGSLFQVSLENNETKQGAAWLGCLQEFTIPMGTSTWPVSVSASYNACGASPGVFPVCENGQAPPLPVGDYQAVLETGPNVALTAAPVSVQVVP